MEIERKFLIHQLPQGLMEDIPFVSVTNILQTYLSKKDPLTERRIRQRGNPANGYSFFYTEKANVARGTREENEKEITANEYLNLLLDADTRLHQISKVRRCFIYKKQHFEVDYYSFDDTKAIMEIELNDIDDKVEIPPFINVIREVTDDPDYKNSALARIQRL